MSQTILKAKENGNEFFRNGEYKSALSCYGRAIEMNPINKKLKSILYCSRGMANFHLKEFCRTIGDCTMAARFDKKNRKAYFWAARGFQAIGAFENAVQKCNQGINQINRFSAQNVFLIF